MNRAVRRVIGTCGILAVCLAGWSCSAQKAAAPAGPEKTRQLLVTNAHTLESRGRPDMAIQVWQQVLLSDPTSAEALAGLARDYKLSGQGKLADEALAKLRSAHPNDPNIAKIEALATAGPKADRLRHAGELARQGRSEDAMRIYRELYGDHPPDDIALAYYQTLYGTTDGKAQAIAGMRALVARNPADTRAAVELGRLLTYDPRTRAEGIRILKAHSKDQNAQAPLRQALLWDAANPSSAGELREYLSTHPQDEEIAGRLKQDEAVLAKMNSGIARTPAERAAFAALNAHQLQLAESRLMALIQKYPKNGRAAAGMGFLRMQQNRFGDAVSYLTQAEENGYKVAAVESALATSRFWYTMSEAAHALDQNQFETAASKYREALSMRPQSFEALNGMAGLLMKQRQYAQAAGVFEEAVKIAPRNADALRGLFLAYARDGKNDRALAVANSFPPAVRQAAEQHPDYLRTLATVYQAENRPGDAQRVLAQALALPFPDNGTTLKMDTRLEYAGILMDAHRYGQAVELYRQMLNEDAGDLSAWLGLVSAHHEMAQDEAAIGDVESMPPATYEAALNDIDFLTLVGSIYQQANRFDTAQMLLERAVKLQQSGGGQAGIRVQLQLAAIYLQTNNVEKAYPIYRQVLSAHPDSLEAWKGVIATLQATNHTSEALQEIGLIPPSVRRQLELDVEFWQTEASVYAAAGEPGPATEYLNRVQQYYARQRVPEPPGVAIQNAWLLYNTKNDRALYPALMRLGGRQDLTVAQRETVQTIWANWSVRRATDAMENNNAERATEILEAATQAFPENETVRKVLAGGYLKTGRAKEALAIYKSVDLQDGSAADFQGAIGAALAASDRVQAEAWLRIAMARYPHDYLILGMAARFEEARGDKQRASDYWRAALAAMPPASPTSKLAHELAYPETSKGTHRASTAADLQRLLDPNSEPFPKTIKLPPLPAYGADPYNGTAPVTPGDSQMLVGEGTQIPATTQIEVPAQAPLGTSPSRAAEPPLNTAPTGAAAHQRTRKTSKNSHRSGPANYSGTINLPPSEENITTTEAEGPMPADPQSPAATPEPSRSPAASRQRVIPALKPSTPERQIYVPEPQISAAPSRPSAGAVDDRAAQVQALFADQTDAQVTQGASGPVRLLANAPVMAPLAASSAQNTSDTQSARYNGVQYTPSAQEATTGAFSAPAPQASKPALPLATEQRKPRAGQAAKASRSAAKGPGRSQAPAERPQVQTVPTLSAAAGEQSPQAAQEQEPQKPVLQTEQSPGVSDEELQQQNLPPLRGPWVRIKREPRPVSPREEAEQQLASLESGYSGWLGGNGTVNYRSGDLGYDHLTALEAPFEVSAPLGYHARLTVLTRQVFLDSGQADGTSVIQVQESTGGARSLVVIPQPLGTDTNTGNTNGTSPPLRQNASGTGGEIQLAFPQLSIAGGYTPYGLLISNWTARVQWRPGEGPFTFTFQRDSVKDTQLSYAGLRDPGSASLAYPGNAWGGVMANQGGMQFSRGDAQSGFYVGVGGQYLTGYNVQLNNRIDGTGGAYWRVWTAPEYGTLNIGANFFGMHYAHNQNAYTFGMGGYFSPQAYFLAGIPFTWVGHAATRWHYTLLGGLGVQGFQQDATPLFPLAAQKANQVALGNATLPALTSVGPNYNLRGEAAYQIGPHWFAGGFLTGNNTRNYASVTAGFSIHYMFRSQPSTVAKPTGLFPSDGLRPFSVP